MISGCRDISSTISIGSVDKTRYGRATRLLHVQFAWALAQAIFTPERATLGLYMEEVTAGDPAPFIAWMRHAPSREVLLHNQLWEDGGWSPRLYNKLGLGITCSTGMSGIGLE